MLDAINSSRDARHKKFESLFLPFETVHKFPDDRIGSYLMPSLINDTRSLLDTIWRRWSDLSLSLSLSRDLAQPPSGWRVSLLFSSSITKVRRPAVISRDATFRVRVSLYIIARERLGFARGWRFHFLSEKSRGVPVYATHRIFTPSDENMEINSWSPSRKSRKRTCLLYVQIVRNQWEMADLLTPLSLRSSFVIIEEASTFSYAPSRHIVDIQENHFYVDVGPVGVNRQQLSKLALRLSKRRTSMDNNRLSRVVLSE